MVVLAFVQHDSPASYLIECDAWGIERDVVQTSVTRNDVSKIAAVSATALGTSMTMHAMGVVVTTHALASVGHVSGLVNMESMLPVAHPRNTHILNFHLHSSIEIPKPDSSVSSKRSVQLVHLCKLAFEKNLD